MSSEKKNTRRVRPLAWLRALRYAPPDSTLRAVLRAMIEFMDEKGYCFPSQEEIADAASLSAKATRDKLAEAARLHWLERGKLPGRRWKHYWYQATVPDFVDLKKKFKRSPERRSPESPGPRSHDGGDHRNVVPGSPERGSSNHRNDVPTNSPSELSNELPTHRETGANAPDVCDGFDELEQIYPRGTGSDSRTKARREYRSALRRGHSASEILNGARRYRAYINAKHHAGTQYVAHLSNWLREDKFTLSYDAPLSPQEVKAAKAELYNVAMATIQRRRRENKPVSMTDLAILMSSSVDELIAAGVAHT